MTIRSGWFNLYLLAALLLATPGCKSPEERKRARERSTIQLHVETPPDGSVGTTPVPIYRASPTMVYVDRSAFLDERHLNEAAMVDIVGGFAIRLRFNSHGRFVLENTTTGNRGRRIAIFATFGESRWLAAPVIAQRIADGTLTFVPDADRVEAERIVRGLNNFIASERKKSWFNVDE